MNETTPSVNIVTKIAWLLLISRTARASEPCFPWSARPEPWMLTKTQPTAVDMLSPIAHVANMR